MRPILVAGLAMLGGVTAAAPNALAQLQTQYPYNAPAGSTPVTSPAFGTDVPNYVSNPPVTTSNVTVRLAGRLSFNIAAGSDSGRNNPAGNTKLANYDLLSWARLYPSFDVRAANGLKYGAYLEIRQDVGKPAGGGANGSISASTATRGQLYFRRETGYLGTDELGYLRFGATDQPTSLFIAGTFENFNGGGWNGDTQFNSSNTAPVWPFEDVGNLYSTTKVVYVSPKFFALVDFGVSFEPNTGTVNGSTTNTCSYGNTTVGTGCNAASSTSFAAELKRRRNTIDAVARLRTAIGPVGVAGTIGTVQSGTVAYNGITPASVVQYDGLNALDAAATATFGGFAVGGHILAGRVNGQWELAPKDGRDAFAYVAGASYAFGPAIVGVQYFNYQSAGSWTRLTSGVARSRNEWGIGTGGTLTVAPGFYVMLSYLYGNRHQSGVDLLTGTTNVKTNNNTRAQNITLTTQFRW